MERREKWKGTRNYAKKMVQDDSRLNHKLHDKKGGFQINVTEAHRRSNRFVLEEKKKENNENEKTEEEQKIIGGLKEETRIEEKLHDPKRDFQINVREGYRRSNHFVLEEKKKENNKNQKIEEERIIGGVKGSKKNDKKKNSKNIYEELKENHSINRGVKNNRSKSRNNHSKYENFEENKEYNNQKKFSDNDNEYSLGTFKEIEIDEWNKNDDLVKENLSDEKIIQPKKMYGKKLYKKFYNYHNTKEKNKSNENNRKKTYLENQNKEIFIKKQKNKLYRTSGDEGILLGAEKTQEIAHRYLSEGNDNVGVENASKLMQLQRNAIYHTRIRIDKHDRRKSKREKKYHDKKTKNTFKQNLKELKKDEQYKKSSLRKKIQKRRQMKSHIYNNKQDFKQKFQNVLKTPIQSIIKRSKITVIAVISGIIFTIFLISSTDSMMLSLFHTSGSVVSTTYLSERTVLTDIDQTFSSFEQSLKDELDSVEQIHTGYDEYIVRKSESISHDTHQLLSYVTSRFGEIKDVIEIENDLRQLFDKIYYVTYKEEIETRYRTVEISNTDNDGNVYTEQVEEPYEYKKLIVTLYKNDMDKVVREIFKEHENNLKHYESLLLSKGNMEEFFGSGNNDSYEIIKNPVYENPGIAFDEPTVKQLFSEAEKHIGKPYKLGANGPNIFDCSSFVCWSFTHSGVKNMPRTSAYYIFKDHCYPISPSEAKAGDLIFFGGTYNSGTSISHVGIYAGKGMMLHAGSPVQYTSINTKFWKEHFYSFGRVHT